jgi:hypothetical protein
MPTGGSGGISPSSSGNGAAGGAGGGNNAPSAKPGCACGVPSGRETDPASGMVVACLLTAGLRRRQRRRA